MTMHAGVGALYCAGEPYELRCDIKLRSFWVELPRQAFASRFDAEAPPLIARLNLSRGLGRIAAEFCAAMALEGADLDPQSRAKLGEQFMDIIALAISAVNGATGAYGSAAVLVALAKGAGRVVAACRNADKLHALARLAGRTVVPVILSGDVQKDAGALRDAAGGGAEMAFDMVGGATDFSSTLAALNALRRRGRLVLRSSMTVALPVPYAQLMINSLEIIGNFMYPADAYRNLLALVRAGRFDPAMITRKTYQLEELSAAMVAARLRAILRPS